MGESLIVRSKVKEYAKTKEGKQLSVSGDFAEHLNKEVAALITRACERAVANKRSTIQPRDL